MRSVALARGGKIRRRQSRLPPDPCVSSRSVIVDSAVYRAGVRDPHLSGFDDLAAACRSPDALAWLGLYEPAREELEAVASAFGLHELAVEDVLTAHQRPKLERYGDVYFMVLRPARYVDETETVVFGELHVFAGPSFVITIRHGEAPNLGHVRRTLEARPELLARGAVAVVYGTLDHVVDGYFPVIAGLENDIDEIEDEVFGGSATVSRRMYELTREVIEFQRATKPLAGILRRLIDLPGVDDEERQYLRDVQDHSLQIEEGADGFRALLQNILTVHLTLETKALTEVAVSQNEQVQKISAWAAILFAPTLIGTIYGMNFKHMPELRWQLGYPMAIALMVAVSVVLYLIFKRRRWI
ncbi:MAG: magnesium transporter [Gaiellales bacterium]|nr:magnesium transporter [Gaiellales bacterium]